MAVQLSKMTEAKVMLRHAEGYMRLAEFMLDTPDMDEDTARDVCDSAWNAADSAETAVGIVRTIRRNAGDGPHMRGYAETILAAWNGLEPDGLETQARAMVDTARAALAAATGYMG
jgi:hypothetical protein